MTQPTFYNTIRSALKKMRSLQLTTLSLTHPKTELLRELERVLLSHDGWMPYVTAETVYVGMEFVCPERPTFSRRGRIVSIIDEDCYMISYKYDEMEVCGDYLKKLRSLEKLPYGLGVYKDELFRG